MIPPIIASSVSRNDVMSRKSDRDPSGIGRVPGS